MQDYDKELKLDFLKEANHLLESLEHLFLRLENDFYNIELIEEIFRLVHNLKGTSRAVGLGVISEFSHELESLVLQVKEKDVEINPDIISLLLDSNDYIKQMIKDLQKDVALLQTSPVLIERIKQAKDGAFNQGSVPIEDGLPDDEQSLSSETYFDHAETTVRVSLDKVDALNKAVSELVILQSALEQQKKDQSSIQVINQLSKVTDHIQEISTGLKMVSLKSTMEKLLRIVRDTSKELNKKAKLVFGDIEKEVDKSVLELIADPLVHMVRNAIDHGIETPFERSRQGKSETGEVTINLFYQNHQLIIEVKDDGKGIDLETIKRKAVEKKILSNSSSLSEESLIQLIFDPNFSTKQHLSEISGRGVGMNVVKMNIKKLSGNIKVTTAQHEGSTFRIELPLTSAIVDGTVVRVGHDYFVVLTSHIHELMKPARKDIESTPYLGDYLCMRGENFLIKRMSDLLQMKIETSCAEDQVIIMARNRQQNLVAIAVDDVVQQQKVRVKNLDLETQGQRGLMGRTTLKNGKMAFILNIHDLCSLELLASPVKDIDVAI